MPSRNFPYSITYTIKRKTNGIIQLNWFGGNPGGRYIPVSHDERRDWTDCTRSLLHDFDQGSEGNRAACDMWVCLHNQASKYHRGGILTTASNLLTPFCTAAGVILPVRTLR